MINSSTIANSILGVLVVSRIFKHNVSADKLWILILLTLAHNLLAHGVKINMNHEKINLGYALMFFIYLMNTFYSPLIQSNFYLSIAITVYTMLLIKDSSKMSIFGFIIAIFVYLFESYEIIAHGKKSFYSILKLISFVLLIIYYINHILEPDHGHSSKSKKTH